MAVLGNRLEETYFKKLPFPVSFKLMAAVSYTQLIDASVQVHPSQRSQLQQHKANAVAKEAILVARKKEHLLQLQKYVLERIEGKIQKPRPLTMKV